MASGQLGDDSSINEIPDQGDQSVSYSDTLPWSPIEAYKGVKLKPVNKNTDPNLKLEFELKTVNWTHPYLYLRYRSEPKVDLVKLENSFKNPIKLHLMEKNLGQAFG